MQKFPKLPDTAQIIAEGDKVLFLIPEKPDWVITNTNTAFLLSLCTGKNSIEDISKLIEEHPDCKQGISIIENLNNNGFFDANTCQCITEKKPCLSTAHINMTSLCNIKCIYCYAEERNNISDNLSLIDYYYLIDDIYNINPNTLITFTGGEPLLSPLTMKVAEYCKAKKMPTFLLTNGTMINSYNVNIIIKLFDKIRISLDGVTSKIHDAHRGVGSFHKAILGISLLEKNNFIPDIAMTVTNINKLEIPEMAKKYGNRLTFQPLYNVGRAREEKLSLSGEEYFQSLDSADGVQPYSNLSQKINSLRNRGCTKCAIAEGEISISSTGDVYPCHMLHDKQFKAGNIRETSFYNIYYNSDILNTIRSNSVEKKDTCKECPIRKLCGGGCWARAYYANGNLNSSDIFCDYELLAFKKALFNVN